MQEFKVGDRVILTGESWGNPENSQPPFIGETVTITGHNASGNPVFHYYDEDKDFDVEDLLEIDEPDWAAELISGNSEEAIRNRAKSFAETVAKLTGSRPAVSEEEIDEVRTLGEELGISSFEQSVRRHTDRIADMLVAKNLSYGDAALNPIRVFSKADRMEQLYIRLDDKLSRVQKGHEYPGDDTIQDIIGYCLLVLIARESA